MDDRMVVCNRCGREKIDARYEPLIAAAVDAFVTLLPGRVVDVRVTGSVARGEDRIGESDIDFVALVDGLIDESECRTELDDLERTLHEAYRVAWRVDLMALPAGDLPAFPRFVLSSDSVSVYGEDELTLPCQSMHREELAKLITADAGVLIDDYRAWVRGLEGGDGEALRRASRVIGKDLLRCVRGLALLRGSEYDPSVDCLYEQIVAFVPEHANFARQLHNLIGHPADDLRHLLHVLDRAEGELLPTLQTVSLAARDAERIGSSES